MVNYKHIHIGQCLKGIVEIKEISSSQICSFFQCDYQSILEVYEQETIDSGILLRWCKFLDYNMFMFYHSHLQLYTPSAAGTKLKKSSSKGDNSRYVFRKNLYSPEVVDWILGELNSNRLSVKEVMEKYNIPRTTIYRWQKKYQQKQ